LSRTHELPGTGNIEALPKRREMQREALPKQREALPKQREALPHARRRRGELCEFDSQPPDP
jgi:hypothetical protein